jgi:N-acetylglucosamine-6-phosphate deacetylase
MPPLHHRQPGLVAALLADERVTIGLIPDGIHVHPALTKLVWQAAGPRLNMVSDAMSALGMPPGNYQLGQYEVTVDYQTCRLADGTLAGSKLSMDTAVRNLMAYSGCSLAEAIRTVTVTPAALLGMASEKGKIAPGFAADLVLLTADREVAMTIVNGEIVYRKK